MQGNHDSVVSENASIHIEKYMTDVKSAFTLILDSLCLKWCWPEVNF